jgi:hypothetical protein
VIALDALERAPVVLEPDKLDPRNPHPRTAFRTIWMRDF